MNKRNQKIDLKITMFYFVNHTLHIHILHIHKKLSTYMYARELCSNQVVLLTVQCSASPVFAYNL